jgi:tetratricopeptide (TPR) repeat protein
MVLPWLAVLFFAQSASDLYNRADEMLRKRDLPAAQAAVDEALQLDPRFVPALTLQAKLAMANDQLGMAQQALETAITVAPKQPSLRFLLGVVFYLKNDFNSAMKALTLADSGDPRVVLYQGMTEEALNHADAARNSYERAMKLDHSTAEPRIAYARLLFKQGDLDRAQALIDESLKLEPTNADALFEKGRCLFERGEYAPAAEFGERALTTSTGGPLERRIRYLLVRAYQKQGASALADKHRAVFEKLPMPMAR